jgi:hypothetical protein
MLTRSTPAKRVLSQVCSPHATPRELARAGSRRAPESSRHGAVERTSTTVVVARAGDASGEPVYTPTLRWASATASSGVMSRLAMATVLV